MIVFTDPPVEATEPEKFHKWKIGGIPWQNFVHKVRCTPLLPVGQPRSGTIYRLLLNHMDWIRGGDPLQNLGRNPYKSPLPQRGHPWHIFDSRGYLYPGWLALGVVDTVLVHHHHPIHMYLLLYPPLPHKAYH